MYVSIFLYSHTFLIGVSNMVSIDANAIINQVEEDLYYWQKQAEKENNFRRYEYPDTYLTGITIYFNTLWSDGEVVKESDTIANYEGWAGTREFIDTLPKQIEEFLDEAEQTMRADFDDFVGIEFVGIDTEGHIEYEVREDDSYGW